MSLSSESARFVERRDITRAWARRAVDAVLTEAVRQGWQVSVAVVDSSARPVAFERMDGAIGVSADVAAAKVRTAALLQAPSKAFEDFINDGRPSFLATPGVTPLEGGLPIMADGHLIGAVGVSGAHGANDTHLAEVAAACFGERIG